MFFKIDVRFINKYKNFVFFGLIFISILSVSLNIIYTPNFIKHTQLEEETINILKEVDNKFIILATPSRTTSYPPAYYSYATIYYNLSSSGGWYPSMKDSDYINKLENLDNIIKNKECSSLKKELYELNTSEVITYDEHCNFLEECGFNKKINKSRVCLYFLKT